VFLNRPGGDECPCAFLPTTTRRREETVKANKSLCTVAVIDVFVRKKSHDQLLSRVVCTNR